MAAEPTGRYAEIANAIRAARLRRKWSQAKAARKVGVSRFHWIRWEQGLHRPSAERVPALIAMGVPAEVFADHDHADDLVGRELTEALDRFVRSRNGVHV